MRRLGLLIPLAAAAIAVYAALTRKRTPSAGDPHPEVAAHAGQRLVETKSPSAVSAEDPRYEGASEEYPGYDGHSAVRSGEGDETAPSPDDDPAIVDSGVFSIGGWAAAPGHSVVSAVTYRTRLDSSVSADRIQLNIEMQENVPDGGLIILTDPGFEPDREGFTILLAAADPGPFSASGSYEVVG